MFKSSKFLKIQHEFDNGNNSHSYMFYTNDFLSCKKDLDTLIKQIFKNENLNSLESDYVIIKRSDKKNILKDDMVELKNFFQKTSYINDYRIYLIEEAHKLNSSSANMILKFLEEPNKGVIAFFITNNLDSVLSTIKSRTQIVNVFYEKEVEGESSDINSLLDFFKKDKYESLFIAKNYFKKYDRNMLIELFNNYLNYCCNNLYDNKIKEIKKINRVISMLNNNVNVDYVFDYLILGGE